MCAFGCVAKSGCCLLPCAVDGRLTEAAAVKDQEALRQKMENSRRQAMDISTANMRPRPDLGGDDVNINIVKRTLDAAHTDKQCISAFETCEWGA